MSSEEEIQVTYTKVYGKKRPMLTGIPDTAKEIAVVYNVDIKPGTLFYDTKEQKLFKKSMSTSCKGYAYVNQPNVNIFYKDGGSQEIKTRYILKYIKETDEETLHDMSKRKTAKVVFK